jgi:hypothetical protein
MSVIINLVKVYLIAVVVLVLVTWITSRYISPSDPGGNIGLAGAANIVIGSLVLYHVAPFAKATVEHALDTPIGYGECRVKNIPPDGNGYILIGEIETPDGRRLYHVRAYTGDLELYDLTCRKCKMPEYDVAMKISNYSVEDMDFRVHSLRSVLGYLYTRAALVVRSLKHRIFHK